MSVKHFWLKNEDGAPSFLCGAVSVVCDYFNADLLEKGLDIFVESDVLYIGSSNEIPIEAAIKSRLTTYMQNTHVDDPIDFAEYLDGMTMTLKKSKISLDKIIAAIFSDKGLLQTVTNSQINDFCASVCHFFSMPKAVYDVSDDLKNNSLVKEYYVNRPQNILIVEFTSYALMLVVGTDI